MKWKIYYGDHSTFSSENGSWLEAPVRNVQALVTPDLDVGRVVDSNDFYIWWPEMPSPWACDAWGLMDYLLEIGHITVDDRLTDVPFSELRSVGVKLGRSLPNKLFRDVWKRAIEDPDFEPKSARYPHERL